jgi:hypothetical protein
MLGLRGFAPKAKLSVLLPAAASKLRLLWQPIAPGIEQRRCLRPVLPGPDAAAAAAAAMDRGVDEPLPPPRLFPSAATASTIRPKPLLNRRARSRFSFELRGVKCLERALERRRIPPRLFSTWSESALRRDSSPSIICSIVSIRSPKSA